MHAIKDNVKHSFLLISFLNKANMLLIISAMKQGIQQISNIE